MVCVTIYFKMMINNVFLCRLKMGLQGNSHARISWAYWFKKILYYQVALVYMLTRLVVNVSQVTKGNSLFFCWGGVGPWGGYYQLKIMSYCYMIFLLLTSSWFSWAQAYLAFYVINDLRMGQSAKALVCAQTLSTLTFLAFLLI